LPGIELLLLVRQLRLPLIKEAAALPQRGLDRVEIFPALLELGLLRLDLVLELLDDLPNRNAVARQMNSSTTIVLSERR